MECKVRLCKLGDTIDNLSDVAGLSPKARLKALAKARTLLAILGPGMPPEGAAGLDLVREFIERLEASPG